MSKFKALRIPLPSLDHQQRIATELQGIFDHTATLEAAIEAAKAGMADAADGGGGATATAAAITPVARAPVARDLESVVGSSSAAPVPALVAKSTEAEAAGTTAAAAGKKRTITDFFAA